MPDLTSSARPLKLDEPERDRWYTLGAFRGCDAHAQEHGINYAATMESYGPDAVAAVIAAADHAGMLTPIEHDAARCGCYAVLDVRSFDGDILTDRCIPTRDAFDWWVCAVELDADMADCPVDEPGAHERTYAWVDSIGRGSAAESASILLAR